MKISKETIALLKNFATINGNMLFQPGNVLSTISVAQTVFAAATVKETFSAFGIYDLNEFLSVISAYENDLNDLDFEFDDKKLQVTVNGTNLVYRNAEENVLTYPSKLLKVPKPDVEFDLSASQMRSIMSFAGALRAPNVVVKGEDGKLIVKVCDVRDPDGNSWSLDVGTTDKTFDVFVKVEHLKMIPGAYTVQIAAKKVLRFVTTDLEYIITLETGGKFGY